MKKTILIKPPEGKGTVHRIYIEEFLLWNHPEHKRFKKWFTYTPKTIKITIEYLKKESK
jgi:hypothetical protein